MNAAPRGADLMRTCPTCGSAVAEAARSCPTCGAALAGAGDSRETKRIGVLPPGAKLNGGSFSVGKVLGRGGFGITYLGADLRLKRSVAIKEFFPAGSTRAGTRVILPGVLSRAEYELAIRRFMEEAQMVARFRHRSIVNVYEVFQENDTAYMVMEYLQGENLLERMERRGAALGEFELVAITEPLSEALEEIHAAGVLHRDIKPENIMLVGPDDAPRPVLIDFGAAREFASGMANRHSIMLTPGYAPLEQYGEQTRRGPFTDIYALAATLYHVATAEQPPAATERVLGVTLKPPRSVNPLLSAQFDAALMHGLEIKVDQRPQSAGQFYRELSGRDAAPSVEVAAPAAPSQPAAPPPTPPSDATALTPAAIFPAQPTAAPASDAPHLERVRRIARQLTAVVQSDRIICPICRNAALQQRFPAAEIRLCPVCAQGELLPAESADSAANALLRCPACRVGSIIAYATTRMLVLPDLRGRCDRCRADFDFHADRDALTLESLPTPSPFLRSSAIGETRTRAEWAALAGDATGGWYCPTCNAALHPCADNGLEIVAVAGDPSRTPREHRGRCLSMAQWAKIAHNVPIDNGMIWCPSCDAQLDAPQLGSLALLRCSADPYGTFAHYGAQPLATTDWQRIAAGGVPEADEATLLEAAHQQLWTAMLLGEFSSSRAGQNYPGNLAPGEKVVIAFNASVTRTLLAVFEERTEGQAWLTTRTFFYRGAREDVSIALRDAAGCTVLETADEFASPIEIGARNGSRAFRFTIHRGTFQYSVEGLTLTLPWTEDAFVELFENLRQRA